jgi:ketosteroid isomerase-like protein
MPQENIELVRRGLDLVNRGDIEGALELFTEDFEMDWSNSIGPAKGIYRGRVQIRGFWDSFVEAFDALRWDPEEFIEVDESRLIVVNHVRMRGRGSGVEVEGMGAQLWTFREGKAQSFKLYQSRAEALEAVGLSE